MGIKGLKSLIYDIYEEENRKRMLENNSNNHCGGSGEKNVQLLSIKQKVSVLEGKRLSIDLSLLLHRALHKAENNDEISSIFKYFIAVIILLKKYSINPVFVFDGKPPNAKNTLLEKRRSKREKALTKIKTLNKLKDHITDNQLSTAESLTSSIDLNSILEKSFSEDGDIDNLDDAELEYISSLLSESAGSDNENFEKIIDEKLVKEGRKGIGIKDRYIIKLKELFDIIKIPYIHIEEEADIVCKYLVTQGYVDGCISDDMDLLAYGCPVLIQNLNFTNDYIDIYKLDEVLTVMGITQSQLLDLCICAGNDFNNKLINIKCKEIYTYIKEYENIENIIENLDDINAQRAKNIADKGGEYKSIKVPYQFKYENTRLIFNKVLPDQNNNLINYNHKSNNCRYVNENVNSNNINEFNNSINYVFENTNKWNKKQIRNKLSKIMFDKFSTTIYYSLNNDIINTNATATATINQKVDASVINNTDNNTDIQTKKNILTKYYSHGSNKFKNMTKRKRKQFQNNSGCDYDFHNHNMKLVNIFSILDVEA